jgi:hypothetical protein
MEFTIEDTSQYLTQQDLANIQIQVWASRLVDPRCTLRYFDESTTTADPSETPKGRFYLKCDLYDQGQFVCRPVESLILNSSQIETPMKFNIEYNKVSFATILAFSIFSMDRDTDLPIASTIVSLYDQMLTLREGPHLLLLYPERKPDLTFNSNTPGLVDEPFINDLTSNYKYLDELNTSVHSRTTSVDEEPRLLKIKQEIENRQLLLENAIPFAFLDIFLKKFSTHPITHDEQIRLIRDQKNDPQIFESSYHNLRKLSGTPISSYTEKNFIPISNRPLQNLLKIRDFDYDLELPDPVLSLSLLSYDINQEDDENAKTINPDQTSQRLFKKFLAEPAYKCYDLFSPIMTQISLAAPKATTQMRLFYKYRYWVMKKHPEA